MKIREALRGDLKQIVELNEKYLHETGRDYEAYIGSVDTLFLVAEDENRVVGFSSISLEKWNNSAWVNQIVVEPKFRRKGFASKMIRKMVAWANKKNARVVLVESQIGNVAATNFYIKNGFRICGYNDRYYTNQPTNTDEIALFLSQDLRRTR